MKIHFGIKNIFDNKAKKLFIFCLFLIVLSSFVSAYDRSDYVKLLYNTPKCYNDCEQIYRIYKLPNMKLTDFTSMDLSLQDKTLTTYKATDISKEAITKDLIINSKPILNDFKMFYYTDGVIDVTSDKLCENKVNSSFYVCGVTISKVNTKIWKELTFKELNDALVNGAENTYIDIKFTGTINRGNSIDIILSYAGFTYTEYALWNFTANYVRWDFENNVTDMGVGYSYDWTQKDAAFYRTDKKVINSYSFGTGASTSILRENTGIGAAAYPWSIGMWVYLNTTAAGNRFLLCNGIYPTGDGGSTCIFFGGVNVVYSRPAVGDTDTGVDAVAGVWEHWILTRNGTHYQILRNGTSVYTSAAETPNTGSQDITVGAKNWGITTEYLSGYIDNVIILNRTVTEQDIIDMMSNVTTQPFTPDIIPPSIVFNIQTPADLFTLNSVVVGLNITYNITDSSGINNSLTYLYYKVNDSSSNIQYYQNGSGYSGYFAVSSNINNSIRYDWNLQDNSYLSGTYNYGEITMENTPHSYLSSTENILIEFYNISKATRYGFFEVMTNSTSTAVDLPIYYCNSSYTVGTISSSTFCFKFSTLQKTTSFNHTHTGNSSHQVFIFAPDTNGRIGTVGITPISYFIVGGVNNWNTYYINTSSRTNAVKTSNNNGATWISQAYTIDAHLHQFNENTTLYYYACSNDTLFNGNCSAIRSDVLNFTPLPPSQPIIIHPKDESLNSLNSPFIINYTASVSPISTALTGYNITLHNSTKGYLSDIAGNNSGTTYSWSLSSLKTGEYYVRVKACDINGLCSYDEQNFSFYNYSMTVNAPADKQEFNQSDSRYIDFNLTINGVNNGTNNCSLYINNTFITSKLISFETETMFNNIDRLKNGNSTFYFNCSDIGTTPLRTIILNDDINFSITSYVTTTGLNNASVLITFNYEAIGIFNIANYSVNNSLTGSELTAYLTFTGLESDTTYEYSICGISDLEIEYCINDLVLRTKSYDELNYNLNVSNNQYLWWIIIGIFLLVLYIISEIFRIEMLGILSGIGFLIFAFTFTFTGWLFIVILFTGVVIFARSVLAWLW